jgi:hypothetical protein
LDHNKRSFISAICKSPFFADARPFQELPSLKLQEIEMISKRNINRRFGRATERLYIQLTPQSAEVQGPHVNKPA